MVRWTKTRSFDDKHYRVVCDCHYRVVCDCHYRVVCDCHYRVVCDCHYTVVCDCHYRVVCDCHYTVVCNCDTSFVFWHTKRSMSPKTGGTRQQRKFIHSFSILSDDRSKASSKTMPPHSAIQSLLLQMRISSPVLKVILYLLMSSSSSSCHFHIPLYPSFDNLF